ncbi:cysteine--tRNA ligase [SAR202 cluster bacterium AD-804-J14_MRT_500m]|nr:cysteine--tRNA ligase [SAR202 cluster bacterium AD-804-J14_MRT_500m]
MLHIYNTLSKQVEEFKTLRPGHVSLYTCGPTVYRFAHIGNLRSYLMADWIRRTLMHQGLQVEHIKNITDVGHMRQEQLERGGDKVILAALSEGKSPQEIAQFYTDAFHKDESKLNIMSANHYPRATNFVPQMIDVVQQLIDRGFAYEAGDNIYFDVSKYAKYGQLSGNTGIDLMDGVRMEVDPLKSDPRDFTLWKHAEPGRPMKWNSPWGEGFPGWHIECSAMSTHYLGAEQDIHTGGVDNIFPHHEDEIAQSEGAFGKQYVRYWVHGQHLLADGVKMAKSAGNEFILSDLETRGFDPLALRYLCLTVRYRHRLNFTFSALKGAQRALTRLQDRIWSWRNNTSVDNASDEGLLEWRIRFWDAVNDDLNMPRALAITWDMVHSSLSKAQRLSLLLEFDELLGLGLSNVPASYKLEDNVYTIITDRENYRRQALYDRSDQIRTNLIAEGYQVLDSFEGPIARPMTNFELQQEMWPSISSPREVDSLISDPSKVDYSIIISACNYLDDLKRCTDSILKFAGNADFELLVVDNGSTDGSAQWLEEFQRTNQAIRVIHCDHQLGDAQAKNIGLKQSRGRYVIMLDTSVEVTDAYLAHIKNCLEDPDIGVIGAWGIRSADLHHFHDEVQSGDVDAMQAYCFAFRRNLLEKVGLMRECFRFYRNLDLDYSFQFRNLGYRIIADGSIPIIRHEHRQWSALGDEERDQLSKKNFKHFFKRWGHRNDLLVSTRRI